MEGGHDSFSGGAAEREEIGSLVREAYESVRKDVETLIDFAADLPEGLEEELRKCLRIPSEDLAAVTDMTGQALNIEAGRSGVVLTREQTREFIRMKLGEYVLDRLGDVDHYKEYEQVSVASVDNLMRTARRMLLNSREEEIV
jgi:hypothetical protein